ncbi:2'-5' RNA ligase family protein [Methylibium sp.]|uniref:2'-5' RNA ligase family protein n=1 Tax=Methylibium sp. TaxID=2067992 RepID=UPI003D14EFF9
MERQSSLFESPAASPAPSGPRGGASGQAGPGPSSTLTCFFALRPAPDDARRIAAHAAELTAAHGLTGRSIAARRLHVTLDLVGHDVDETALTAARHAAATVRFAAFDVVFDHAMTFGAAGPYVLLGGTGVEPVRGLRLALACAMADAGFRPEHRFEPHMTLHYDHHRAVARHAIPPVGFHARSFDLVVSHVGLSQHEVLGSWPLT